MSSEIVFKDNKAVFLISRTKRCRDLATNEIDEEEVVEEITVDESFGSSNEVRAEIDRLTQLHGGKTLTELLQDTRVTDLNTAHSAVVTDLTNDNNIQTVKNTMITAQFEVMTVRAESAEAQIIILGDEITSLKAEILILEGG